MKSTEEMRTSLSSFERDGSLNEREYLSEVDSKDLTERDRGDYEMKMKKERELKKETLRLRGIWHHHDEFQQFQSFHQGIWHQSHFHSNLQCNMLDL